MLSKILVNNLTQGSIFIGTSTCYHSLHETVSDRSPSHSGGLGADRHDIGRFYSKPSSLTLVMIGFNFWENSFCVSYFLLRIYDTVQLRQEGFFVGQPGAARGYSAAKGKSGHGFFPKRSSMGTPTMTGAEINGGAGPLMISGSNLITEYTPFTTSVIKTE